MPWRHSPVVVLLTALLSLSTLEGQESQRPAPPRFRVSVDVVRIDAVVTDRHGRIVRDLTVDDFEVFQDGKRQKVTFAQFVPVLTHAEPGATVPAAAGPDAPVPATPLAAREEIQRTFAIVVDDLGLSFESLHSAKRALHAFVDRDLRPSDLVAVVRTGGAMGGLQPFTIDKRVLHAAIDGLRWNGLSRNGVQPYEALNSWTTFDNRTAIDMDDFALVEGLRTTMSAAGSLGALNLIIQGARDLPGRKAVILVTEGFQLLGEDGGDTRVRRALDQAVDRATRAGVVIYTLDARGLQTAGLTAADNLKRPRNDASGVDAMGASVRREASDRLTFNRDTQEGMAYLAEQTGGFAVLNTNDLSNGLGRISEDVRDYYMVGYVPDDSTFAGEGRKPRIHKISIRVRKPGLRVRTRREFLGVTDPEERPGLSTPPQQLLRAAVSPFLETEIALRATALPAWSPEQGTFVRALLHIDARALTFAEDEAGKHAALADVLGMVFDRDGTQVAHLSTGFSVALMKEAAEEALREGLAYTLRIPVRKPGAYQVRFAVRDRRSGRLGSAGEFVEIADIAGGAFALSGIVLRGGDSAPASVDQAAEPIALAPSQALRVYRPGTHLSYAYEIYNAATQVKAASSIWRDRQAVLMAPPSTLAAPVSGARRFAARGSLKLGEALPPGTYVLQVAAATPDPTRSGRTKTAVQRIAFDVQ